MKSENLTTGHRMPWNKGRAEAPVEASRDLGDSHKASDGIEHS